MGWQVADEVAARAAEIDDRNSSRNCSQSTGFHSDKIDDWVRRKQVLTVKMLKDSPRLYPGVADLIRKLHGRVRLAVVSGTWRENIQAVLDSSGLAGSFETIVGKEDVASVKAGARGLPSCVATAPALGAVDGRHRRFAHRAGVRTRRGNPLSSPSAIAIPSATGSATPPTSRDSNRSMACSNIWDCHRSCRLPVREMKPALSFLSFPSRAETFSTTAALCRRHRQRGGRQLGLADPASASPWLVRRVPASRPKGRSCSGFAFRLSNRERAR